MTPSQPSLAIVIVAYRSRGLLTRCLESVREHGAVEGQRPEVWVVDNASLDGTAETVRERFPEVHLLAADENLGFSAANNWALRELGDPSHVLLLNPDTVLHQGTLASLIKVLGERPEVGMIGCRLVRPDGRLDHAGRRSFPTIVGALGHFTGFGRRDNVPTRLSQYRATHREDSGPVDAINGAFMLIRRAALEDVGAFDEGYWMYMEDLDLCYRFWQKGWEVWYETSVATTHIKAGTSGAHRLPRQNRAFHYGMYRFYRKFYASDRPALLNATVYAGIALKLCVSMTRSAMARRRAQPA